MLFTSQQVCLSFWVDPHTGMVSQWNVGAWRPDGEPETLRAHVLPFPLFLAEVLEEASDYLVEYAKHHGTQQTLPFPRRPSTSSS